MQITANSELELVDGKVKLFGYLWIRFVSGTILASRPRRTVTPAKKSDA